ncbi:similar to 1700019E19Rik protein (predicted), isoform CRA_f [Rattus norvegicus]|uniref:Similar to 1700019E19Rik protein (Predicted), isoform CRA_f n=1 Tax=Rattus norvegicus TaxID=10116 RepID=A6JE57_RAT|nr:similar to 1700019E19Rik protein (predicted), isoform CRA_f [Rattus norvegicus]
MHSALLLFSPVSPMLRMPKPPSSPRLCLPPPQWPCLSWGLFFDQDFLGYWFGEFLTV